MDFEVIDPVRHKELLEAEQKLLSPDTITIPKKEYDSLWEDRNLLCALQCCGVDNWDGYSDAVQEAIAQNKEDN